MNPKLIGGVIAAAAVAITAGALLSPSPAPAVPTVFKVPDECRSYEGAKSDECRAYWDGFYTDGGSVFVDGGVLQ